MANIGIPGLILILMIALIVFGPAKLPQLGKAVGQTLAEFKKSTSEVMNDVTEPIEEVKKAAKSTVKAEGSDEKK